MDCYRQIASINFLDLRPSDDSSAGGAENRWPVCAMTMIALQVVSYRPKLTPKTKSCNYPSYPSYNTRECVVKPAPDSCGNGRHGLGPRDPQSRLAQHGLINPSFGADSVILLSSLEVSPHGRPRPHDEEGAVSATIQDNVSKNLYAIEDGAPSSSTAKLRPEHRLASCRPKSPAFPCHLMMHIKCALGRDLDRPIEAVFASILR